MNLIETYIQEVTRRLPEKSREDIALELRSTIEDMLSDEYSEEEVKSVLEKLGNPAILASGYRDQPMHLIGPRYFDIYVTLLKMILPIAGVIAMISMIAESFIGYGSEEAVINVVLNILGVGIWRLIEVGLQVFFWLTLIFAIIERTEKGKGNQPLTFCLKEWTPDDLKNIAYIPKKQMITKCEVFGSLLWTAIWATLYFYSELLVGVYEGNGENLDFITPALNQDVLFSYWSIVLVVIGLDIALSIYKLIKGHWTKNMAIFNTITEIIGTIVFIVIFSNSNLFHQDFIMYMTDLLSLSANQFKTWVAGGIISIYVVFAVFNIIDGFYKTRIEMKNNKVETSL